MFPFLGIISVASATACSAASPMHGIAEQEAPLGGVKPIQLLQGKALTGGICP